MLGMIDSHAHYEDKAFDEDRDELLGSMSSKGVDLIVNVGSSIDTTRKTLEYIYQYPFVYGTAGVHPEECGEMTDVDIAILEQAATHKKVVAIGEIGLDYYWPEPDHEVQQKWFHKQLELAVKLQMPIIIHSREAALDTLRILKEYQSKLLPEKCGVIHCFSYTTEIAREYIDMGYYIGVGGVVTFNNAKKLKQVVADIPLKHIVIETDSPYMAPVPNRGDRNCSAYLTYVVDEIAAIKQIPREEVVRVTSQNALDLYRIEAQNG